MGNRVARLAYSDECFAAARKVLQSDRALAVSAGADGERRLYSAVYAELHKKSLGMPPGMDRASLAAAVREMETSSGSIHMR